MKKKIIDELSVKNMHKKGISLEAISKHYGVPKSLIQKVVAECGDIQAFSRGLVEAAEKPQLSLMRKLVLTIKNKNISLQEASNKYNMSERYIQAWINAYDKGWLELALLVDHNNSETMRVRLKLSKDPQIKELQLKILYLEAENLLLKKKEEMELYRLKTATKLKR